MPRCYNVVFDSVLPYVAGTTHASDQYFVNWEALMPDKPYKVTMSFVSAVAVLTGTVVMGVMANLGGNDVYCANTSGYAATSNYLGSTHSSDMTALHYANCSPLDNPPIYINQRPNQNLITIQLTNGANNITTFSTPNPANYVLVLNFEEQ